MRHYITITNKSDITIYPEILIKKYGKGNIKINNLSTGQVFKFNDIENDELIYIDNDKEIITSNFLIDNPGDRFNDQFLYLIRGVNTFQVDGDCNVRFRFRYKYLPHGGDFDDS